MAVPYLRRLVAGFPPQRPGFEDGPGYVGFVVDKVALVQVSSEYSGFSSYSTDCAKIIIIIIIIIIYHLGLVQ
jgi:hypothetical protein